MPVFTETEIGIEVAQIVKKWVGMEATFTAYDVTKTMRALHPESIGHDVVRSAVHASMQLLREEHRYVSNLESIPGGIGRAWVYRPSGLPDGVNAKRLMTHIPIDLHPLDSTMFESFGWDVNSDVLRLVFKSSKGAYDYKGIPFDTVLGFVIAASHGQFYHEYIKPNLDDDGVWTGSG